MNDRLMFAFDLRLPALQKIILLIITYYSDESGYCEISLYLLARISGISKKAVKKYLNILVDRNLISIEEIPAPKGTVNYLLHNGFGPLLFKKFQDSDYHQKQYKINIDAYKDLL